MLRQTLVPLLLLLALPVRLPAQPGPEGTEQPEVIVVTGRLPGPPLWRISNGDNVLWIFPSFAPVPKRMQWDSARVERVLAEAGVYLTAPSWGFSFSSTGGPKNWRDEARLNDRLMHSPGYKKLQEVLRPELYARYAALKERYFPRNDDIDELRPLFAMQSMRDEVQREAGLAPPGAIFDQIEKLARKNRRLQRIDTSATLELELPFVEVAERMETMMNGLGPKEHECFELELRRMEIDLDAIKRRANEWANGRIGEFRAVQLQSGDNPCQTLLFGGTDSEALQDLARQTQEKWLSGAESALTNHRTSFAVLDIADLLKADGLLSRLAEKGFAVSEP